MSEKREITLSKPVFIKVKELERSRNGYNVFVRVISADRQDAETKDGKKIPMLQAVVGDETGCANAFFKGDEVPQIKKDTVIAIRNGVKKIIKGHISLEIDAFGRVTVENNDIKVSQ